MLSRARGLLCLRTGRTQTNRVKRIHRAIRYTTTQLPFKILVVGAAHRIRCVGGNASHFECFAVIERGVSTTMAHDDRMLPRHFIEIASKQSTIIAQLGVVEKISFDPSAGRQGQSLRAQLVHDTGNADKLHFEWIAHKYVIQQGLTTRMEVAVNEAGNNSHALRINHTSVGTGQITNIRRAAHSGEFVTGNGECFGQWCRIVYRVNLCVDNNIIRVLRAGSGGLRSLRLSSAMALRPIRRRRFRSSQ